MRRSSAPDIFQWRYRVMTSKNGADFVHFVMPALAPASQNGQSRAEHIDQFFRDGNVAFLIVLGDKFFLRRDPDLNCFIVNVVMGQKSELIPSKPGEKECFENCEVDKIASGKQLVQFGLCVSRRTASQAFFR